MWNRISPHVHVCVVAVSVHSPIEESSMSVYVYVCMCVVIEKDAFWIGLGRSKMRKRLLDCLSIWHVRSRFLSLRFRPPYYWRSRRVEYAHSIPSWYSSRISVKSTFEISFSFRISRYSTFLTRDDNTQCWGRVVRWCPEDWGMRVHRFTPEAPGRIEGFIV